MSRVAAMVVLTYSSVVLFHDTLKKLVVSQSTHYRTDIPVREREEEEGRGREGGVNNPYPTAIPGISTSNQLKRLLSKSSLAIMYIFNFQKLTIITIYLTVYTTVAYVYVWEDLTYGRV